MLTVLPLNYFMGVVYYILNIILIWRPSYTQVAYSLPPRHLIASLFSLISSNSFFWHLVFIMSAASSSLSSFFVQCSNYGLAGLGLQHKLKQLRRKFFVRVNNMYNWFKKKTFEVKNATKKKLTLVYLFNFSCNSFSGECPTYDRRRICR